jgi:hypothetical protein
MCCGTCRRRRCRCGRPCRPRRGGSSRCDPGLRCRRGRGRRSWSWLRTDPRRRRWSRSARPWRRLLTGGLGRLVRFRSFFSGREVAEMLAHELGMLQIDRTRVRLFFRDADFRQELDQNLRLDLQFACQLIDPDLIRICHSPLSSLVLPNTLHSSRYIFQTISQTPALRQTTAFPRSLRYRQFPVLLLLRWPLRLPHQELPPRLRPPPGSPRDLPAARHFRPWPLAQ